MGAGNEPIWGWVNLLVPSILAALWSWIISLGLFGLGVAVSFTRVIRLAAKSRFAVEGYHYGCSALGGSTEAETNPAARTATNAPLQTSVVAHQTDGARETSTTRRPSPVRWEVCWYPKPLVTRILRSFPTQIWDGNWTTPSFFSGNWSERLAVTSGRFHAIPPFFSLQCSQTNRGQPSISSRFVSH